MPMPKYFNRIALILFFLVAAIVCYAIGLPAGSVVFVLLGLIFEGLFWLGIFSRKKKST